jgi:FlaA1/EpsC-like NDP-sugar epimerase
MYLQKITESMLAMPRLSKRLLVLLVDSTICVLTVWLAYYLRLGEPVSLSGNLLASSLVSIGIAVPLFMNMGLYRQIFRYTGLPSLKTLSKAIFIYGLFYASIYTVIGIQDVPRTVGIIQPILLFLFIGISRASARIMLGDRYQAILKQSSRPRSLIYGAGSAGYQLLSALAGSNEVNIIGFLDDDKQLFGQVLNGRTVHNPANLITLVKALNIRYIFLALPNITRKRRNEILDLMRLAHVSVRTMPNISALAIGKITLNGLQELDVDDLLGRDTVPPDKNLLEMNIVNRVVMVTGAGGSIGAEICRQIRLHSPAVLLMIEHNEYALYSIHQEFIHEFADQKGEIIPLLVSVTDKEKIEKIISTWKPEIIFHAAAYKHVPFVEHNQAVGIENNVFGTLSVATAANRYGVSNFVLISTDKAVRPTNVMGASKRLSEMILQAFAAEKNSKTVFSIVRFGNVLDSSGSVVPKFRQQILEGGPITITHPDINRYFMTITEASQLVIQAGALSKGGEVFVLDMGLPVKIADLARRMIELQGLIVRDNESQQGDIEILVTGLRPGEKLYEELLIGEDCAQTSHPKILRANEQFISMNDLEDKLKDLKVLIKDNDIIAIQALLKDLVSGFSPDSKIVDWIYNKSS